MEVHLIHQSSHGVVSDGLGFRSLLLSVSALHYWQQHSTITDCVFPQVIVRRLRSAMLLALGLTLGLVLISSRNVGTLVVPPVMLAAAPVIA